MDLSGCSGNGDSTDTLQPPATKVTNRDEGRRNSSGLPVGYAAHIILTAAPPVHSGSQVGQMGRKYFLSLTALVPEIPAFPGAHVAEVLGAFAWELLRQIWRDATDGGLQRPLLFIVQMLGCGLRWGGLWILAFAGFGFLGHHELLPVLRRNDYTPGFVNG